GPPRGPSRSPGEQGGVQPDRAPDADGERHHDRGDEDEPGHEAVPGRLPVLGRPRARRHPRPPVSPPLQYRHPTSAAPLPPGHSPGPARGVYRAARGPGNVNTAFPVVTGRKRAVTPSARQTG